jgi:hypothetical protein
MIYRYAHTKKVRFITVPDQRVVWREKQIVKIMGQTDQLVNIKDRIVFLRLYNSDEVTPIQDLLYWKNIHLATSPPLYSFATDKFK